MSELVIVSSITAATGLLAAFGGTYLANRHTRSLARSARREALDDEARRLVVDVLEAASLWVNAAQSFGIALAGSGSSAAGQAFLLSTSKDGVVNDMGEAARLFSRATSSAVMLLPQSETRQRLEQLRDKTGAFGSEVTVQIMDALKGTRAEQGRAFSTLFAYCAEYREQLKDLEVSAGSLFGVSAA